MIDLVVLVEVLQLFVYQLLLIVSVNVKELLQMMTYQVAWVMFLLFVVLVLLEEEVVCVCFLIVSMNV